MDKVWILFRGGPNDGPEVVDVFDNKRAAEDAEAQWVKDHHEIYSSQYWVECHGVKK